MPVTTGRKIQVLAREPRSARRRPRGARDLPAVPVEPGGAAEQVDAASTRRRRLTLVRRTAITIWALVMTYRTLPDGLAFNRELLLLYIATGLIAASIGRGHKVFAVVCDWLPFAIVLLVYDLSRGAAALLGAPTLWHFQPQADRWLFFGTVPTVWLQ